MDASRRVLGAQRSLEESVSRAQSSDESAKLVARIARNADESFSLQQLEGALNFLANRNSNYTKVGEDEIFTLTDEILNNAIRSVLVFDDFTGNFCDTEVYCISLAFQHNLSVEAVTLSGIMVTDDAIVSFCESLLHSRVNYLDLTNTPLEDEAGHSLAALAHLNPYLRTVVVGDTLISEDVLDEIDVACQFNQSNFEGNNHSIDDSLLKEKDYGRLKSRMHKIIRSKFNNIRFCVANLFGCCPNGDGCLSSHNLSSSGNALDKQLTLKITELFSSGGDWEDRLPPPVKEGASSWLSSDEKKELKLNLNRLKKTQNESKDKEDKTNTNSTVKMLAAAAVFTFCTVAIIGFIRRR